MNTLDLDWDLDEKPDAETAYQALRRALDRGRGFSLLFVRCTPVTANNIIQKLKQDLPQKATATLAIDADTDNLYDLVVDLSRQQVLDVLFVQGMEAPMLEHERQQGGDILERSRIQGYGGSGWETVPRILGHLNLSRERFRDDLPIAFVFFLPEFALNYFIRRAPDFFDWRSNVFEFPTDLHKINREAKRLTALSSYERYARQTSAQHTTQLAQILTYLEAKPSADRAAALWLEKGLIHAAEARYEAALKACDKALEIDPNFHQAWNNRGAVLGNLGRYEEALESFGKALEIKPDARDPIYNKACCYALWAKSDAALEYLKQAITLDPDKCREWAKTDPDFDSLRDDPRFQTLVRSSR